ncbi:hypothetical protein EJB05_36184, partial [Eragrostis curvula]
MSSLLAFLLLCSLTLAAPANASDPYYFYIDCPSNTNYTCGSAFQAKLNALLSSLPTAAAASSGFAKNITGAAPDQAYGVAQCRGDINASDYLACLGTAAQDPARFTSTLVTLMGNLTATAAYESRRMFAVGSAKFTPFVSIYGMAQCTRDLAADDCNSCLTVAVTDIPTCCNEKKGARINARKCFIRFEEYPFYNVSAAEAAMSLAPSPAPGPINGSDHSVPGSTGSKRTVRTALVVSVPVAFTLLVLLLVALYLCKRKRKPHKQAQIASVRGHGEDEEMRSSESLMYDLSTLRAATDNFSEENKLGEGGFGPVYKVMSSMKPDN